MATSHITAAGLGRKTLLQAVKLYESGDVDNHYPRMVRNTISSRQQFEEIATYSGLAIPPTVEEYGAIQGTEYQRISGATFRPEKKAIIFGVSAEAFEDEQSGYGVLKGYGTDLAQSFSQARDISAANRFMNFANTAGVWAGPDGVAYGSANHPVQSGVWSNVLTGNPTLSPQAIGDAFELLMRQPAHATGMLMPVTGRLSLEVHPSNWMLANEIVNSSLRADTSNNATNVLKGMITDIVVNPYFTNVEWWSLSSVNARQCRRFHLKRTPLTITSMIYNEGNDSYRVSSRERYLMAFMDWRGAVFSFPA